MGLPGSGALVGARLVVDAYGLDEKKDFKAEYVKSKTVADMIRDNHLDAFITVSGYPNAAIVEMASTQGAELVKVAGAERDALIQKAPFYSKAVIPGGTYKGNDNDVETVAVGAAGYHAQIFRKMFNTVSSKACLEIKKLLKYWRTVMLRVRL